MGKAVKYHLHAPGRRHLGREVLGVTCNQECILFGQGNFIENHIVRIGEYLVGMDPIGL